MSDQILLSVGGFGNDVWLNEFKRCSPNRRIVTKPAAPNDTSIKYAVVWKQPEGLLSSLPNLKLILSAGAGVDHIMRDTTIPDMPIVRIVASDLTARMSEYVVWQALDHLRQGPRYRMQQSDRVWLEDRAQIAARSVTVGILGLGVLGTDAVEKLQHIGFHVIGWSRREKRLDNVTTYSGIDGLDTMLSQTDILVCLLPLTEETKGLLSAPLFGKLKKNGALGGPVLINAGRGGLQCDADILSAVSDQTLKAVSLDVFETEPLNEDSPLWAHPSVSITPHAAAASNPTALVPEILKQIDAFEKGEPLCNLVDRHAGY